jgi:hypothetical protein
MSLTSLLMTARAGEIHLLRGPHYFTPVVSFLQRELASVLSLSDIAIEWDSLSWEQASTGLQTLSQHWESDPAQLALCARTLKDAGVVGEFLLEIPFAKGCGSHPEHRTNDRLLSTTKWLIVRHDQVDTRPSRRRRQNAQGS